MNCSLYSPSTKVKLTLTSGGELTLFKKTAAVWSSGTTDSTGAYFLVLNSTDNGCSLEVHKGSQTQDKGILWRTTPATQTLCRLDINDDQTIALRSVATNQVLWTSSIVPGAQPAYTSVFVYQPRPDANPITIRAVPGDAKSIQGGWQIQNSYVEIDMAGGIPNLFVPVITLTLKGKAQNQLTSVSGVLVSIPIPEFGPATVLASAAFTAATQQPVQMDLQPGSALANSLNDVPLVPNQSYIELQTLAGAVASDVVLPVLQSGLNAINGAFNTHATVPQAQAVILLDPNDPGLYMYGGVSGTKFAGLSGAGIGFSSRGLIPFVPTTTTHLPPGAIPGFSGQMWLTGAIPIEDIDSTLTGVMVVDIGQLGAPNATYQLGVNASLDLDVPFLGDILDMHLNYANATVYQTLSGLADYTMTFDVVGGDRGLVSSFPLGVAPSQSTSSYVSGSFAVQNGVPTDASYVTVGMTYAVFMSQVNQIVPSLPKFDDLLNLQGSITADPINGVTLDGSTAISPVPMFPLHGMGNLHVVMTPTGAFRGAVTGDVVYAGFTLGDFGLSFSSTDLRVAVSASLNTPGSPWTSNTGLSVGIQGSFDVSGGGLAGSANLSIPIGIPAGQYAQMVTNQAVCGVEALVNSFLCGYQTVTDAASCGADLITSAAQCGESTITDAGICGEDWIQDAGRCGESSLKGAANCGSSCAKSGFTKCKCKVANHCSVPKTCNIANQCSVPRTCNIGGNCMGVSTCNWSVTLPNVVSGSIRGAIDVAIGPTGSTAAVGGSGTIEFCNPQGACNVLSGVNISLLPKATMCARGFPGVSDVLCVDF